MAGTIWLIFLNIRNSLIKIFRKKIGKLIRYYYSKEGYTPSMKTEKNLEDLEKNWKNAF